MAGRLQLRRGTTLQNEAFTGAVGEPTLDTETGMIHIHDGQTQGGKEFIDAVVAFQKPTAENNYTWFRKYASGWVEQGGKTTTFTNTANGTSDNKTVVLPITMLDANYNTTTTRAGGSPGWSWRELCVSGKTTTQFTIEEWTNNAASGTTCYAEWQVSGMAA